MSGGVEPLHGNTDEAVDFLARWYGDGARTVVTIHPETDDTLRRDFQPKDVAEMRAYIAAAQGRLNFYIVANACKIGRTSPTKAEMTGARCLHLDADLKDFDCGTVELLDRIRSFDPPPSVVAFSGGGYQAEWRYDGTFAEKDWAHRIEAANAAIAKAIGAAPGCQNINRLLRLPGTVNVLNSTKRAAGRQPAAAYLVEADWDRTWSFARDPVPRLLERDDGGRTLAINTLPEKLKKAICSGDPKLLNRENGSRSELVWYVVLTLLRRGWPDDQIVAILLRRDLGVSGHIYDQDRPTEYAARQVAQAREEIATAWERHSNGSIKASLHNTEKALSQMGGVRARYDAFRDRELIAIGGDPETYLDDALVKHLWVEIERRHGFRPDYAFFDTYLTTRARQNSFHPVREYLKGLVWDSVPRLDDWLYTYAGAVCHEDDDYIRYVRAVGRITLIAAVRRVRQPGCKFDEMLSLVSETQGVGKSTLIAVLGGDWFSDNVELGLRPKEAAEQLDGVWIAEISELQGRNNEVDRNKAFLSRTVDQARPAYGRRRVEKPRQCVFIGTTNKRKFLKDRTGNRRYLPVEVGRADIAALERDRDQLWAEAAAREARGESIRLPEELWAIAEREQKAATEENLFLDVLAGALGELEGKIRCADAWMILGITEARFRTQAHNDAMGEAMRELGWRRQKSRFGKTVEWAYVKGDSAKMIFALLDPTTRSVTVAAGEAEVKEDDLLSARWRDTPF
jgi:hypothetical protein